MNLDAINQQQQGTAARQTFDMSRLKLLNANAKEDKLSKEEASAVVRYNFIRYNFVRFIFLIRALLETVHTHDHSDYSSSSLLY
jgi:hypothetical protein